MKLWKPSGEIKEYFSNKIRRILSKVEADKFVKGYVKVSYGKRKSNMGKYENFYNDGTYQSKEELIHALHAFTE